MLSESQIRSLVWLLIPAALLILAVQALDVFTLARTTGQVGAEWRIAVFGQLAQKIGWFVVADAFLVAAVVRLEDRLPLRALGWTHLFLAILVALIALVAFRDARSLGASVPGGSARWEAIRLGLPLGLFALLLGAAGWYAVRGSRRPRWASRKRPPHLFTDTESR